MNSGLQDVVAADTVLSDVDGLHGRLIIRGFPLSELAGKASFEEVVHLLFSDFFRDLPRVEELANRLAQARCEVDSTIAHLVSKLDNHSIYDAMRIGVAYAPDGNDFSDAVRIIAAPAVLIPALVRRRAGLTPIAPDPSLGHSEDIVRMLGSTDRSKAEALDTYLVTVSDHGMNASTFASRVVASTQSGLASAALAGLSALKGPLHGGAPGPVIDMLDAIAIDGDGRAWLSRELANGERLMGFGHRIYQTRDPRADALKSTLVALAPGNGRLADAEQVETLALELLNDRKPDRALKTNVEFYTAILLEAIGFPREAFTGVFAMGRVAGWLAHAREQASTGRLMRPQSRYVGPSAIRERAAANASTLRGNPKQ